MPIIVAARHVYLLLHLKKEKGSTVPFSMAIGNEELVQECFPTHSCRGTGIMKKVIETEEKEKHKRVKME